MKRLATRVLSTMFLMVSCAAAWAQASSAYQGRSLYVSYCLLCHGPGGKGDGPLAKAMQIHPADLTTTVRSRSDTILKKIISGRGRATITGRDRHYLLSDAMPEWLRSRHWSAISGCYRIKGRLRLILVMP